MLLRLTLIVISLSNTYYLVHGGPEARIGWGVTPQKIFLKLLEEKDL